MGGGQDSTTTVQSKEWDVPWVSEEETSSDNVSVASGDGSLSDGEELEELQGSISSCLVSSSTKKEYPSFELRRRILQCCEARAARDNIRQTRGNLNRYTPGSSMLADEGKKSGDFVIPDVATLLVVGLKGAGKSTLINNVIRVLLNKSSGVYRAHVSDDPCEYGTYFMGEYMICGASGRPRVSLFDTRGLSEAGTKESMLLLEGWMKDGVRHGQIDLRASDSSTTKESLETRGRHGDHQMSRRRNVNFVIFVIDAVSVLRMKESGDKKKQAQLVQLYKNPYLTFKDDRPVVVMTHGDKLSQEERVSVQIHLGEILGVPPVEQIFDISGVTMDCTSSVRDITLLDMLSLTLECADRNLPYKRPPLTSLKEVFNSMTMSYRALDHEQKVALIGIIFCVYILFILFILACVSLSRIFKNSSW